MHSLCNRVAGQSVERLAWRRALLSEHGIQRRRHLRGAGQLRNRAKILQGTVFARIVERMSFVESFVEGHGFGRAVKAN